MAGEKTRAYKKYVVVGCILLLLLSSIVGYEFFGVSRPNRYTAYSPLTGRVFRLHWEEIENITVIRSSYGSGNESYETPEDIRILTEYLNGFRCSYRFPKIPEERSGGSFVYINYKDGESAILGIAPYAILIENNWYFGETEYFTPLYYGRMESAAQSKK